MQPKKNTSNPTKQRIPISKIVTSLLMLGSFVLGGFLLPNIKISWSLQEVGAQNNVGLGVRPGIAAPLAPEEAYARATQIASPAIVNIDTQQQVRRRIDDDFFISTGPRVRNTQGSGVIVNKQGDILTNEHVVGSVNEGTKIFVTLNDGTGRRVPGIIVAADRVTDVALVRIEANNLPVAKIGTSKGLVPGQMVVAIGNPLGFRFTVTHGVVSALGRPIEDREEGRTYENLIQTDCAINPGNSGGALVNLQGQVIGINTMIASNANGIGFAIPIDTALQVAEELKRYGKVKRPWLGVLVTSNSPQLAFRYDLPDVPGVIILQIAKGGPAIEKGLARGDVITKINNKDIRSEEDFKAEEKRLKVGQRATLEIRRGDEDATVRIQVGESL